MTKQTSSKQVTPLSLWNLSEELNQLQEKIIEKQGEIEDQDAELLEEMNLILKEKADACIQFIDYQKSLIKLAKQKKTEISNYITTMENKISSFEDYIISSMLNMKIDKVQTPLMELKLRKPSKIVHIYNEKAIPPEFVTVETKIKINKNNLKKVLKEKEIDGCELVESPNRSLNIKLRSK